MYYITLIFFFSCFSLIAYTLGCILWPYRSALSEQIGFYEKSWENAHAEAGKHEAVLEGAGFKDRCKALIVRWLNHRGPIEYLKDGLEQSSLSIEWSEFVLYHLLGTVILGTVVYFAAGWATTLLVVCLGVWSPILVINISVSKRQAKFAEQLPETMTMLAGSLKAGYSLLQAVDMVSKETTPPMAEEFRRVITDARLGLPVEAALDKMILRVKNTNFEWMVMAIKIQREVGGNLVEVLTTLAHTIRERETVQRQIKVLTAEGRLSAYILIALPIAVGGMMFFVNRPYMLMLFNNIAGLLMFGGAIALMIVGALWLRKIVKIEV